MEKNLLSFIVNHNIRNIVIVDNEITPFEDGEKLVSRFLLLRNRQQQMIVEKLPPEIKSALECIAQKYTPNIHLQQDALEAGVIEQEFIESQEIEDCYISVKKAIGEINMTFLRFGIANINDECFDEIVSQMLKHDDLNLIVAVNTEMVEVDYIKNRLRKLTEDESYVAIVDKIMDASNAGIKLINDDLMIFNNKHRLTMFSVILTTNSSENVPSDLNDFYTYEVSKLDPGYLQQIQCALTYCMFLYALNKIKEHNSKSSEQAYNLGQKYPQNIAHVIEQSRKEGLSVFCALLGWYKITSDYYLEKSISEIVPNLTYFLNSVDNSTFNYIKLDPVNSKELKEVKVHEIYDLNINKKSLPISNGDIFEIKGETYILFGQNCDLSLRGISLTRNSKIAELQKIEIINERFGGKIKSEINENNEVICVQDWNTENDRKAKIYLNEKSKLSCDLKVLDLCKFNIEGEAALCIEESKKEYGEANTYLMEILTQIKNIHDNKDLVQNITIPLDISMLDAEKEDNEFKFNIRRICRMKEPFITFAYNKFIERKRRTGINTIDHSQIIPEEITIKYGFPHSLNNSFTKVFSGSKDMAISKEEILENVHTEFKEIIDNILPERLKLRECEEKKYQISIEGEAIILKIPYVIATVEKQRFSFDEYIGYSKLFSGGDPNSIDKNITYLDNDVVSLIPQTGLHIFKDLSRGIHFKHNDKSIKYENGYIRETKK